MTRTLASSVTTDLIYEAVEQYGPLSERQIRDLLDESWQATSAGLNRLICAGAVEVTRAPDRDVVLYRARTTPCRS